MSRSGHEIGIGDSGPSLSSCGDKLVARGRLARCGVTIGRAFVHVDAQICGALGIALVSAGCASAYIAPVDRDAGSDVRDYNASHEHQVSDVHASTESSDDGGLSLTPPSTSGTFVDASVGSQPDGIPSGADPSSDAGAGACDFSGTWVAKVTAATAWSEGLAIAAGSGSSYVWVKYRTTTEGTLVPGSMVTCGVALPDFSAGALLGGEHYGVDFGIPLFDTTPATAVTTDSVIQVHGRGVPGDSVTMSETAMVLGTMLTDPLHDDWPSNGALVDDDMDGDGKPGVTIPHLNDATHVYLPVDALRSARSDRGYYAARVTLSASGSVVSCSEIAGQAVVPRFDTHIVGCRLLGGGDCNNLQRDTLDSFRPIHTVNSATYRALKLATDVSCATARATLP